MANEATVPHQMAGLKKWVPVGLIGLLAIAGGIMATRLSASASTVAESSAPARAANSRGNLAYEPPAWPEPPDTGAMLVRLGASTLFVLILCVGTLWVGKRWLNGPPLQKNVHGDLHIAGTLFLGRKCCLYLINVGNRQVLAGVDGSGLGTLLALPEDFDRTLEDAQTREMQAAGEIRAAADERTQRTRRLAESGQGLGLTS